MWIRLSAITSGQYGSWNWYDVRDNHKILLWFYSTAPFSWRHSRLDTWEQLFLFPTGGPILQFICQSNSVWLVFRDLILGSTVVHCFNKYRLTALQGPKEEYGTYKWRTSTVKHNQKLCRIAERPKLSKQWVIGSPSDTPPPLHPLPPLNCFLWDGWEVYVGNPVLWQPHNGAHLVLPPLFC